MACLLENNLDISQVRIVGGGATAYTNISTNSVGEREIVFEEFGVCQGYFPDDTEVRMLCGKRHVHIGWLDDYGALKHRLASAGVSVSQDLGVNNGLPHVTADLLAFAFVSAGPSEEAAAAMLSNALSAGARVAVATCGALGSRASDGVHTVAISSAPTSVIDTTGAVDAFIAGFIEAQLCGFDLRASLVAGSERAAISCAHLGGFPQRLVSLL